MVLTFPNLARHYPQLQSHTAIVIEFIAFIDYISIINEQLQRLAIVSCSD